MSSSDSSSTSSGGIHVLSVLGVVFVVLKLTGFINWSWWWVTLPFWGGLALVLAVIILVIVGQFVADFWANWQKRQRNKR